MSRFAPRTRLTNTASTAVVANWFGNQFVLVNSYESIATVTGTGSSGTLSFTSIPSGYTHLQIRGINGDSSANFNYIQFNSDTGNNYTIHQLYGDGTNAAAYGAANSSYIFAGVGAYTSGSTPYVAPIIIDILDYKDTNKYKTARILTGNEFNGVYTSYLELNSGIWRNTNAISRIDIIMGGNYSNLATFALYGIRG